MLLLLSFTFIEVLRHILCFDPFEDNLWYMYVIAIALFTIQMYIIWKKVEKGDSMLVKGCGFIFLLASLVKFLYHACHAWHFRQSLAETFWTIQPFLLFLDVIGFVITIGLVYSTVVQNKRQL